MDLTLDWNEFELGHDEELTSQRVNEYVIDSSEETDDETLNEELLVSETILSIEPEIKNEDPLTPLNQNYATLDDLQNHYKLFLNRIQQQLATVGGGGETRLEFLDDVNRDSVKVDNHYANPSVAGTLIKVKPTAPNNVVPIAAVVKVDATEGEIFVRPTIDQKYSYGLFSRTTDLAVAATNTAYVVNFDTTNVSNGVSIGTTSSRLVVDQSGLYKIDISAQIDSSGGGLQGATMYMWVRRNGNDVSDSTRRQGVVGVAPATAYAPSTAAVKVTVTQEVL